MTILILTLPTPCVSESYIKIKINLNFYFRTPLWCLIRFYMKAFEAFIYKIFLGTIKKCENENLS